MPRIAGRGSVIATFAVLFLLTGCASGDPTTPSPSPTASAPASAATPTPTPAEAEPGGSADAVIAIVARPESLELRGAGGAVVEELDYLGDPHAAVSAIAAALGAAPVDEAHPGDSHYPPSTAHRWEGLTLWEQRHEGRWEEVEHSILRPRFLVEFTGPTALDVELTTEQGVHAGSPWGALLAEPGLQTNPSGCSGPYLDFVQVDGANADGTGYTVKVTVDFRPTGDESGIARIGAPVPAFDSCA